MSELTEPAQAACIDAVRFLAMDAVQQANSGHPGAPIALAPLAHLLYTDVLRHNPANPAFANRDRFVLSNGHASMLLYASLHLSGYDVSIDDLRKFRQLHSRTPGHPEYGDTAGVETTTGPLGQGAANSVGMAIAGKWMAATFNKPGHTLVDYRVFALAGDGCLMEGVSAEAASLAGHLRLDNLVWFYDANRITIEGSTELAFTEDVGKRFEAYGWSVQTVEDIEDRAALAEATRQAVAREDQPSLVMFRSIIGRGAPTRQNTAKAHGEPLGAEEIAGARAFYGWTHPPFEVPADVYETWTAPCQRRGSALEAEWNERFNAYASAYPEEAQAWRELQSGALPDGWDQDLPLFPADAKGMATRKASGQALAAIAPRLPWLMGGSADLAGSNNSLIPDQEDFQANAWRGRNMRFGVREHGMASIANGMALAGLRPYVASFLVFTDYCRPSIRLSALMGLPVIYVFTHDSIGLGEDGPTHQPVEHLAALRAMPNLDVFRPADANETVMAWRHALQRKDGPVLLALSRQSLPVMDRSVMASADGAGRGGYVVRDAPNACELILMGTGSELQCCLTAADVLAAEGVGVRVVSLPCWELFDRQNDAYRQAVLPPEVTARVAIEAGCSQGWSRYTGAAGAVLAIDRFGASAPLADLFEEYGMTADAVVAAARKQMQQAKN